MTLPDASFFGLNGDQAAAYTAVLAALGSHVHSTRIEDLSDVQVTGISNGMVLAFDAATGTWRVSNQAVTATRGYVDDKITDALTNSLKVQ